MGGEGKGFKVRELLNHVSVGVAVVVRGPPKGRVCRVGGSCQVCIHGVAWAMLLKMTRRRFWVAVAGLVEAPGCHPVLKGRVPYQRVESYACVGAAGFGEQG